MGAHRAHRLLTLGRRHGVNLLTALLLLRRWILHVALHGFAMLLLLRRWMLQLRFRRFATLLFGWRRRAVVATVAAALGDLLQLLRGRLTLRITRGASGHQLACAGGWRVGMLKLRHRRLPLSVAIDRRMLGRAESAGYIGLMIALGDIIIRIRHVAAIGGVVLPVNAVTRQILSGNAVEIIHINIDVIAIVLVAAVMVIVIMMMVIIVIIPVDAAEERPGGGDAEAVTKTFDEAIGELLPGGGGR